jgi:deoxycytidine triphosphate deaminase
MMSDEQIRAAVQNREIVLDPFDPARVEPASYDIRVGNWA